MTGNDKILNSLLPQVTGLITGTMWALNFQDMEAFNNKGAAETLKKVIGMLDEIRTIIEKEHPECLTTS